VSRTARDAAANDTGHRYTGIKQIGLLLRLDLNAGELAHLAHFTADLLYANTRSGEYKPKREHVRIPR
jgi:hypothetical protein